MSDDLISRQAAEMALIEKGQHSRRYKWGEIWELNGLEIREVLDNLPSVQPKEKTGKWLHDQGKYKNRWICTECSYRWYFPKEEAKYCPNCGAKMEG